MEIEKNQKFSIMSVIIAILCIYGTITSVFVLINVPHTTLIQLTNLVLYLLVFYYAFFGYKIPGSRVLKYIILYFGLSTIIEAIYFAQQSGASTDYSTLYYMSGAILGFAAVIVGFMSGRLIRVNECKIVTCVVMILTLVQCVMVLTVHSSLPIFDRLASSASSFIQWLILSGAYFMRVKQCKAAGLEEYIKGIKNA